MAERKKRPEREWYDYLRDPALAVLKGGVGAGEAMMGLADLASGGRASQVMNRSFGYDPQQARAILDSWQSPAQQAANQEVADAQGFAATAGAALRNPSTIGNSLLELAPQVAGAAGLGRATVGQLARAAVGREAAKQGMVGATRNLLSGAAGEGLMGAGNTAAQLRRELPAEEPFAAPDYQRAIESGLVNAATGLAGGYALRGANAAAQAGMRRANVPDRVRDALAFGEVDSALSNRLDTGANGAGVRRVLPDIGTGGNRALAASVGGEAVLENPAQQFAGGFMPNARAAKRREEEEEKKRRAVAAL